MVWTLSASSGSVRTSSRSYILSHGRELLMRRTSQDIDAEKPLAASSCMDRECYAISQDSPARWSLISEAHVWSSIGCSSCQFGLREIQTPTPMRSATSPNGRPHALPTEKRESKRAGKLSNARHPPQQKQLTSQSHHAAPPTDSQGTQQPPTAEEPKATRPAQRTYPTGREKRISIEFRSSRNVRVAYNNMRQRPAVRIAESDTS